MKNTALKLKRIAPGCYQSHDGRFEVIGYQRPESNGYGPAGEMQWYWRPINGDANDRYSTKREAVESLQAWLQERAA